MIPVMTAAESARWDAQARVAGLDTTTLMETAGRAVALLVAERFPRRVEAGVLVACGGGNNGGDGWVAARSLHRSGLPVWVCPLSEPSTPAAALAAELARSDGVREVTGEGPWPNIGIVVDGVLGGGLRGLPRGDISALLARLMDLEVPIVAIDGPSGLDLTTGINHLGVRATLTVSFGGFRRGHLLARDDCGDIVIVDIGLPRQDFDTPQLITPEEMARSLSPLPANAHKGARGRILLIGGDVGMTGAVRLAGRSAAAAGAGLLFVLAPAEASPMLAQAEPELQVRGFDPDQGWDESARDWIERADAVAIGPGLGRSPAKRRLVLDVLGYGRPTVIDADALVVLGGERWYESSDWIDLKITSSRVLLTPHLGEFRTLFAELAAEAALDPWGMATLAAECCGATVLLKGVPTVIGAPGHPPWTVAAGNPGLATGGSGDCLTGLTAALLAQGHEIREAAVMAAHLLGGASDIAARRSGARGLRPSGVIQAVPDLLRQWRRMVVREGRWVRPPISCELPLPVKQ